MGRASIGRARVALRARGRILLVRCERRGGGGRGLGGGRRGLGGGGRGVLVRFLGVEIAGPLLDLGVAVGLVAVVVLAARLGARRLGGGLLLRRHVLPALARPRGRSLAGSLLALVLRPRVVGLVAVVFLARVHRL